MPSAGARERRSPFGVALALASFLLPVLLALGAETDLGVGLEQAWTWVLVAGLGLLPCVLGWRAAAPLLILQAAMVAALGPFATWDVYNSGGSDGYRPRAGSAGVEAGSYGRVVVALGLASVVFAAIGQASPSGRARRWSWGGALAALAAIFVFVVLDLRRMHEGERWGGPGLRLTLIGVVFGVSCAAASMARAVSFDAPTRAIGFAGALGTSAGTLLGTSAHLPLIGHEVHLLFADGGEAVETVWLSGIDYGPPTLHALAGPLAAGCIAAACVLRRLAAARAAALTALFASGWSLWWSISEFVAFPWARSGNVGFHAIGAYLAPIAGGVAFATALVLLVRPRHREAAVNDVADPGR